MCRFFLGTAPGSRGKQRAGSEQSWLVVVASYLVGSLRCSSKCKTPHCHIILEAGRTETREGTVALSPPAQNKPTLNKQSS